MNRLARFLLALAALATTARAATKPNIVFILADDLGIDNVGCYGSDKHRTPNIDKLAASGTRFETCYAAPVCGPSRCLLMTGATLSAPAAWEGKPGLYEDNIRYVDKQVGAVVAELEKLGRREKTLVIFSGDNGTALNFPSTVGGRMLHGKKGSMLEGGLRVPFIANWPGVTPAGKVSKDLLSFADPHATCAELAGVKMPEGMQFDGRSFAPQLRGEKGTPGAWAYVQFHGEWYVREPGFKLNERGELFDMSDAPFTEKPVAAAEDTEASKAARQRLAAVLAGLNPAAGKHDGVRPGRRGAPEEKAADPAD